MNAALKEGEFMALEGVTATKFLQELAMCVPVECRVWYTSMNVDPNHASAIYWEGRPHDPESALPAFDENAAYFSIAAFSIDPKPPTRRTKEHPHKAMVVLLDDVGTKADAGAVRAVLGEPSYRIETSPGNEQWGYLPDVAIPNVDIERIHEKLKELKACDKDGVHSHRYGRLPVGKSLKRETRDFRVRLVEWSPTRRYSLKHFRDCLKITATDVRGKRLGRAAPRAVYEGKGGDAKAGPGDDVGRDVALTSFGGTFLNKVDPTQLWELMCDFNEARNRPPLEEHEVRKIWKSLVKLYKTVGEDDITDPDFVNVDPKILAEVQSLPANVVVLPCAAIPFTVSARMIFARLAEDQELFLRESEIVEIGVGNDATDRQIKLVAIKADAFRSRIQEHGRRTKVAVVLKSQMLLKQQNCSKSDADALLLAKARNLLPRIELVTRSPMLVEHEGRLVTLAPGYNRVGGGVWVAGTEPVADVALDTAVNDLLALVADFQFATPSDKSRAVANFLAPAIRMGRLLFGHATMNVIEADQSQAGKGFLAELQREIYAEPPSTVNQTTGGVGSFDESISRQLLKGRPFILFDNVRGRIESVKLESAMTHRDPFPARTPGRDTIDVDISRFVFQLTSNGFEATADLANRSLITRIVKQAPEHQFAVYAEGGVMQHVKARQPHYLGCVFAVIRHWHAAGKPALPVTQHDSKEWTGTLDWIVQKVFHLAPLLDGHLQAKEVASAPWKTWLRQLALIIERDGRLCTELRSAELGSISVNSNLTVPGANEEADDPDKARAQQIGLLMGRCFGKDKSNNNGRKDSGVAVIDRFTVSRRWGRGPGPKADETWWYTFSVTGDVPDEQGGM